MTARPRLVAYNPPPEPPRRPRPRTVQRRPPAKPATMTAADIGCGGWLAILAGIGALLVYSFCFYHPGPPPRPADYGNNGPTQIYPHSPRAGMVAVGGMAKGAGHVAGKVGRYAVVGGVLRGLGGGGAFRGYGLGGFGSGGTDGGGGFGGFGSWP